MAYLHENKEEFRNAVNLASERFRILPVVAEKDYYVTMILSRMEIYKGMLSQGYPGKLTSAYDFMNRIIKNLA